MRKALIIALGLASLGALVTTQPASATKKRVCQTTFLDSTSLGHNAQCTESANWQKNNCKTYLTPTKMGLTFCYDIDVLVPNGTAAQIGSVSGMNKTFDHNTKTHAN